MAAEKERNPFFLIFSGGANCAVHDASGDEHIHIQPNIIQHSVRGNGEGEKSNIPIVEVEEPLPKSIVAQDEAIAATSTAKSPTSEKEVAVVTAEDWDMLQNRRMHRLPATKPTG
uniref:Uncharacterized protein n=1 Tax=Ananas comosus var. bracteatus TaxID=296719 RepID=A0A6V7PYL9_ANACO|nr:unnamed protein product [Ananas comosus var. bracteatus]